ncbi:MAG: serine/threonine-protein kinase [Polyangiaceae bacterium]
MTSSDREDLSAIANAATKQKDIHEHGSSDDDDFDGPSLVGQVLSDRYRIERHLGQGAMGAVYLAEHTLMHKRVAIKVLHAEMSRSAEVVARFEREAVAAAHIEHPNVASASDFGKLEDGSFFLVLEYIEGIGLRDALEQYGHLPARRALHIATQVCSALVRAHELGIVHRDLKPENVMLVDRGADPDFVKVLDFGIARVPIGDLAVQKKGTSAALTRAGMVYGTPEYMAPEQALGQEIDARADLYALGIMLYEMLTGHRPFTAESKVLLLGMHVTAPVPPMADIAPKVMVHPDVEALVRRLLAKDAGERPADARVVESELATLETICANWVPPSARQLAPTHPASSPSLTTEHTTHVAIPLAKTRISTPFGTFEQKHVAMAAGGLALLVFLVAPSLYFALRSSPAPIVEETSGRATAVPAGPTSTSGAPEPTVELPKIERTTADAIKLFEGGELEAGRTLLAKTKTPYEAPDVQRAVAIGSFGKGRVHDALKALTIFAKTRQDQALSDPFREPILAAASADATRAAAFVFLEANPSAKAADLLYELTLPPHPRSTIEHADRMLRTQPMRGKASRSLEVALSLKEAGQDCEAVKYFDDAAKFGDARALAYLELLEPLKSITYRKVPGHYKPVAVDAYACLRKDGSLARAIAAIKSRLAKTEGAK